MKLLKRNFVKGIKDFLKNKFHNVEIVKKKGYDLLNDHTSNKTCAFTEYERNSLGIRGLVPPTELNIETQEKMLMEEFNYGMLQMADIHPDSETLNIGITPDMIRKWKVLQNIQDLDNTLYYHLMVTNFKKIAPIVYTPTIAWVSKNFSKMFRRPRGMYITYKDKGKIESVLNNSPLPHVRIIVITDGSKIMSIGDWGVGGLPIVISKKDLYVAAGGFHAWEVLPIVLDVGTNNQ